MDNSHPETESGIHTQEEKKRVLLRLASFILLFPATHWLIIWLHPMGAHRFFWNLVLGAVAAWVVFSVVLPPYKRDSS